jgi:hypothetical protein
MQITIIKAIIEFTNIPDTKVSSPPWDYGIHKCQALHSIKAIMKLRKITVITVIRPSESS